MKCLMRARSLELYEPRPLFQEPAECGGLLRFVERKELRPGNRLRQFDPVVLTGSFPRVLVQQSVDQGGELRLGLGIQSLGLRHGSPSHQQRQAQERDTRFWPDRESLVE